MIPLMNFSAVDCVGRRLTCLLSLGKASDKPGSSYESVVSGRTGATIHGFRSRGFLRAQLGRVNNAIQFQSLHCNGIGVKGYRGGGFFKYVPYLRLKRQWLTSVLLWIKRICTVGNFFTTRATLHPVLFNVIQNRCNERQAN